MIHTTVLIIIFLNSDQINEWGVRIHVAGRLSLLPEDLRCLVSRAMLATRFNYKLRLNIAYAYTGNFINKYNNICAFLQDITHVKLKFKNNLFIMCMSYYQSIHNFVVLYMVCKKVLRNIIFFHPTYALMME